MARPIRSLVVIWFGAAWSQNSSGAVTDIDRVDPAGLGTHAVQRLNTGRTEHVGGLERQLQQIVLGLALDARPHHAALLGRIRAAAGDIGEHHAGVETRQRFRRRHGDVVGQVPVASPHHAERGDAKAEEAGVVT